MEAKYMTRCLQLAKNGIGQTYPNPMVGSVIVHQGKIIGEGWHQKAGKAHAEVNAIRSVKNQDLLNESTIYVNLEPCSHYGKTPPCADLIIEKKIPKVVIGIVDTFSEVSGRGIKRLKEAGCEVKVGILEKECYKLNKRFFTYHNKKRPYIFLKWAETADGFIAPEIKNENRPVWITDEYARQQVHQMRTQEQAILIGTRTALADNPKLNVRLWKGKSPLRMVIDKNLKIPKHFSLWDDSLPTIFLSQNQMIFTDYQQTESIAIDFHKSLPEQITKILYKRGIQSLIVEGGTNLIQQFIDTDCWDEAIIYRGKNNFYKGLKAPKIHQKEANQS